MKKVICLIILGFTLYGCSATKTMNPATNLLTQDNIEYIIDGKIITKLNELDNLYLKNKLIATEEFLEQLEKIENSTKIITGKAEEVIQATDKKMDRLLYIIGGISLFLSFIGTKSLVDFHKSQSKLREFADTTLSTFRSIEQAVRAKEKDLHTKHGYMTEQDTQEVFGKPNSFSEIVKTKFLDYDHQIYFFQTYLPITKDFSLYKESLLKLGIFFMWERKYERALLRFEEIENIYKNVEFKENLGQSIVRLLTQHNKYENILATKSDIFFNAYGSACLYCAFKIMDSNGKKDKQHKKYIDRALTYFRHSIKINPNFSKPYYRLGQLYSLSYKDDSQAGINHYNKVFDKEPRFLGDLRDDMHLPTYRNISCCLLRLNKNNLDNKDIRNKIVAPLENIPANNIYWKSIMQDNVLAEIKNTPEWRTLVAKKCPAILS